MPRLNVAAWRECTEVEGPGKRFALWVQGCLRRCPGCCNPHMHALEPRQIVDTGEVMHWILDSKRLNGIEGVTFLGGEPLLQAKGLSDIAAACRREGLSVVTFSGYTLEEIWEMDLPGAGRLLELTDLLIDGPYLSEKPETERNWAGSTNQEFHFLSDRYGPGIERDPAFRRGVELRIGRDGSIQANGWPMDLGRQGV